MERRLVGSWCMCQQVDGAWSVEAEKFVSHASRSKTDVACAIKLRSGSIGQSLTCAAVMTGQCDRRSGRASEASEGGGHRGKARRKQRGVTTSTSNFQFWRFQYTLVHL